MSDAVIETITADQLRDLMQHAGFRVEAFDLPDRAPALRSATAGIPFEVRFGTRLTADGQRYVDFTLIAALRVEGELARDIPNAWNSSKRFSRLHVVQNFLLLDMDIGLFGGVTAAHLRAQIEIWDRVLQELVPFLRDQVRGTQTANGAAIDAGTSAPAIAAAMG
jgi:hypothetical protein